MKTLTLIAVIASGMMAFGCGGDDTTSSTNGGGGSGGMSGVPNMPQIGPQFERMGRPAINTAANHTFDPNPDTKGAAKEAWNVAGPSTWSTFAGEVAVNLAILDSLDANCGNQLLAGPMPVAGRYDTLAGVLAEDRLWVNLKSDTCGAYLAVEANAVMALPNNDCGGRRLADDVIETSYSALAAGLLSGVDDTIKADPAKTGGASFPFLAAPLP